MLRLKSNLVMGVVILFILLFTACSAQAPSPTPSPVPAPTPSPAPTPTPSLPPAREYESKNAAVISDRVGQVWDVTHARDIYDMNPDYFNYGLGTGAIPSVDNPIVLEEGDSGYPEPDSRMQVFGVNHNGEQRAYSVITLSMHEVFNDVYPGETNQYVAITY